MIADRLPLEEGLTRLAAQWLTILPPASAGRFDAVDPGVVKGLRTETRVRKRSATPCRVVEGYGWMMIQYPSHAVSLPARMGPALEHIARTEEFDAASLPGHLTDEERVGLVQRLITEGLLIPA
jgi:lysine-specific demethylase/histidyl-hydroxylase NO66